jgi:hypothetical protein
VFLTLDSDSTIVSVGGQETPLIDSIVMTIIMAIIEVTL